METSKMETRLIYVLFGPQGLLSLNVDFFFHYCSVQDSWIVVGMVFVFGNQTNLFTFQPSGNKVCSLSLKVGFGKPLFCPGFTDLLLFFAMLDKMCFYLQLYGI